MCMCTFFYICTYFSFCVAATRSLAHLDTTAHRFSAYSKVCVIFLRTCRLFNVCVTATCLFCSFTRSMLFQLFGKICDFSTQLNVLIRLCTFRLFCAFTRFSNSSNMHWHMFTLLQGILYACARFLRLCHSNSFLLRIGTSFRLLHAFSVYWPVFFTHLYIFMHLSLCNSVILRIYTFFYLLRWFSAHCHVYLSTPRLFSLLESFSFILRMCTFLCVCACSSACV